MTIQEMICKYSIILAVQNGIEGIKVSSRLSEKTISVLKTNKASIIVELKKQAEELAARKAEMKAVAEKELKALKDGEKKITVNYHDGEYLTGYEVTGQAANLLEELGLCEYVSGWGMYVKNETVKGLSEEFTYQKAVEYSQPARDAKAAKIADTESARQAKFDKAKTTGSPVELERYMANCNNSHIECSTDLIVKYAMPDGSTKTERTHTY